MYPRTGPPTCSVQLAHVGVDAGEGVGVCVGVANARRQRCGSVLRGTGRAHNGTYRLLQGKKCPAPFAEQLTADPASELGICAAARQPAPANPRRCH